MNYNKEKGTDDGSIPIGSFWASVQNTQLLLQEIAFSSIVSGK